MITRFDHAIIAVRDLDEGMRYYRGLGFDVTPGGRHTGLGTHNAIIRFGLDYLELLSIYDENEASSSGPSGKVLLDFLQRRGDGLLGFALATTDIEHDAEHFRRVGLEAVGPFAMQRVRPDGRLLSWRLLAPGGVLWRQPTPFLIQWDTSDEQRLSWEGPGTHRNGVTGWIAVAVAVRNLESAIDFYGRQLGLEAGQRDDVPQLAARRAAFQVGTARIDLLTPSGEGSVQQMLQESGEGPFELTLACGDTRKLLTHAGLLL